MASSFTASSSRWRKPYPRSVRCCILPSKNEPTLAFLESDDDEAAKSKSTLLGISGPPGLLRFSDNAANDDGVSVAVAAASPEGMVLVPMMLCRVMVYSNASEKHRKRGASPSGTGMPRKIRETEHERNSTTWIIVAMHGHSLYIIIESCCDVSLDGLLNNGFDSSDTWAKDAIFFQTRIHDVK